MGFLKFFPAIFFCLLFIILKKNKKKKKMPCWLIWLLIAIAILIALWMIQAFCCSGGDVWKGTCGGKGDVRDALDEDI